ncbi:MAG: glycosyltransferase, partial [Candidatus Micrarchaeaceae archaeon]
MNIAQIHNILIKGDGISNNIKTTQEVNKSLKLNNDIVLELFSDYSNNYELAIADYFNINFYNMFKRFLNIDNKYNYTKMFIKAMKNYKKNAAKNVIENAKIRIWHYGSHYELFKLIHNKDIVYYHNLTFPYLVEDRKSMVDSRLILMSIKDMELFFITQSKFNKECLIRMGFDDNNIVQTIPFHRNNLKFKNKSVNKNPKLVSYGRYSTNKGIVELAKMSNSANINLTVFGDNKSSKEYKKVYDSANKYSKENIKILGKIPRIDTYLFNSDIFILNSYHEGASLPVVEAESFGLPIILRRGTALNELVVEGERRNGYLFDDINEIPELINKIK